MTPAMEAGISQYVWKIRDLLNQMILFIQWLTAIVIEILWKIADTSFSDVLMANERYKLLKRDFWSGFGSVLTLAPEEDILTFEYKGRDLAKATETEGLSQDWKHVGAALIAVIAAQANEDESASTRER